MPSSYRVHRVVDADPQTVWDLLTDAPAYPSWNPAVVSLGGRIALGEKLAMVSAVAPGRTFTLTVDRLDAPRTMVWSGGLPLGLYRGVRTFILASRADGRTDFTMAEVFGGPLAPLVGRFVPYMTDSFAQFGDAVAAAAVRG